MIKPIHGDSVIVGVDAHKYSHTAAALDAWGQDRGRLHFTNDSLPQALAWLDALGRKEHIIVAVEDANSYGWHLVAALTAQHFAVRSVPAILTERDRAHSTQRDKSDYEDARRVGKVILAKYEETLPVMVSVANPGELAVAQELNLLLNERRETVKQQTILKNQLHVLLHRYYGDHYADNYPKPFHREALAFYQANLSGAADNVLVAQSILRRIERLRLVQKQSSEILRQITRVGKTSRAASALSEQIHGCGLLTACAIMAELVTIRRFVNEDKLAKYAGIAPTMKSSGAHHRLYTNPFGNRLLNRALHTIALSQIAIKGDPRGKEYYQKKLTEGKTKLWAMRCLKRQIVKLAFRALIQAEQDKTGFIKSF